MALLVLDFPGVRDAVRKRREINANSRMTSLAIRRRNGIIHTLTWLEQLGKSIAPYAKLTPGQVSRILKRDPRAHGFRLLDQYAGTTMEELLRPVVGATEAPSRARALLADLGAMRRRGDLPPPIQTQLLFEVLSFYATRVRELGQKNVALREELRTLLDTAVQQGVRRDELAALLRITTQAVRDARAYTSPSL
jgi:hypothetical protein